MARPDRVVVRGTLRAWGERTQRSAGDIAYLVYASVLVSAIVLVPLFRAGWLLLSQPTALVVLSTPAFATTVVGASLLVLAAATAPWAQPVARRAFLARVLSDTDARFAISFARPVVTWWLVATFIATAIAALCQGVLWSAGISGAVEFWCVVASSVATTILALTIAVAAQANARVGGVLSALLLVSAVTLVACGVPVGVFADVSGAVALGVIALIAAASIPALIDRMQPHDIVAASRRRDAMIVGFALMETSVVTDAAHETPRGARHISAVPHLPRWMSFAVAAAVGAARTPTRLIRGLATLGAGFALAAIAPSAWSVAVAALIVYVGLGACMTGVQQAAHAARTTAVYGIGDGALMIAHAIFPAVMVLAMSMVGFVGGFDGFVIALTVGAAALLARIFAALTPPTPLELLMPIPTPAGDAAALLRMAWALQGAIAAVALSVGVLPGILGADQWRPVWVGAIAIIVLGARWRSRR